MEGGGRAFLKNPHEGGKRPSRPPPSLPSPKTFDLIESLLQGSAYEKGLSVSGEGSFFCFKKREKAEEWGKLYYKLKRGEAGVPSLPLQQE